MNSIFPHIKFEKLADLAEGRFEARERDRLVAHVSACRRCSERLDHLRRTIEMMRADTSEDAPSHAVERASHLIRTRARPASSFFKQVVASLKFDSLDASQAFGLRAGAASARQLLFSAGGNDIHLQIRPAEEQWVVCGQVLGPCNGGQVELQGTHVTAKASLSDMCEFTLDSV